MIHVTEGLRLGVGRKSEEESDCPEEGERSEERSRHRAQGKSETAMWWGLQAVRTGDGHVGPVQPAQTVLEALP